MNRIKVLLVFSMILCIITGCSNNNEEPLWQPTINLSEIVNLSDDLSLEQISEGVIVINHQYPWPANSLIVEMMDSSIVLVDTPYTPEATKKVLDWMMEQYGSNREIIEINTGFHFDNLGGNQVLLDNKIPIHGSDLTVELINERGEESRELFLEWLQGDKNKRFYDTYKELRYVDPTTLFQLNKSEEKIINIRDGIEIYYPGETHSPDNLTVYIKEKKVLFGGCMIKEMTSKDLGNTADANLDEWPKSINKILQKYSENDVDYVIPGHGKWGTYELLDNTLTLLEK